MLRLWISILVLGGALLSGEDPWIGTWKLVWATASQDNYPRVTVRRTAAEELQYQRDGQPVLRMRQVDQNTAEGAFGRGRQAGTIRCTSNGQELTVLWKLVSGEESKRIYDRIEGLDEVADPLTGRWIFSETKTTMSRRHVPLVFELTKECGLRLRAPTMPFTAAFDGRDHPEGTAGSGSVALKRIDDRTFELLRKDADANIVNELRVTVSEDRNKMQFIETGKFTAGRGHKVSFYERAPAAAVSGAVAAAAAAAALTDDQIWAEFEQWAEALKPLPPGQGGGAQSYQAFVEAMIARGVPREEAERRSQRVLALRRGSVERERVFWNVGFKLNVGPSSPLRLLQEAVRQVKPGRALDAGMGRGRNAIYLASLGWETHGYDISASGLEGAQAAAKVAGVKLTTTKAAHDDFDFGKSRWDLILCAYNHMAVTSKKWPGLFFDALRPGGLVVFQTSNQVPMDWRGVLDNWKQFQILRLEDQDPGYVDDDWSPSRTMRTIMLVARKGK